MKCLVQKKEKLKGIIPRSGKGHKNLFPGGDMRCEGKASV
jgi:hypothetical protein